MSTLLRILVTLVFLFNPCFAFELENCKNSSYDELCKFHEDYDKTKVPGSDTLYLTPEIINIFEVTEVNEIEETITLFLQLAVDWSDENLSYKPSPKGSTS